MASHPNQCEQVRKKISPSFHLLGEKLCLRKETSPGRGNQGGWGRGGCGEGGSEEPLQDTKCKYKIPDTKHQIPDTRCRTIVYVNGDVLMLMMIMCRNK